ncbi:MAG: hypothetical protein PSY14_05620 [bacterium]|nr:hypothetical protein [bacterium]
MTRFLALALACLISTTACADRMMAEPVRACTKDAKMCADGSSVGRTGPDCQFPSCPEEKGPSTPPPEGRQMCTMDAKICPDGSGVGRTGPNCTFAPCPGEKPNPTDTPPSEDGEAEEEEIPDSYE